MFSHRVYVEPRPWHFVLLAVVVITAIGFSIYQKQWPTAYVNVSGDTFKVLVANTYARQVEGWSNKKNMGGYGGMLFTFSDYGQHAMVMRDMDFPLDIIWLDGNRIIDMAPNLPPAQHNIPENELTPYFARLSSTAVLELPAGFIVSHHLKIGDTITVGT